jgi:hypothetical protein
MSEPYGWPSDLSTGIWLAMVLVLAEREIGIKRYRQTLD